MINPELLDIVTFLTELGIDHEQVTADHIEIDLTPSAGHSIPCVRWHGFKQVTVEELTRALTVSKTANDQRDADPDRSEQ